MMVDNASLDRILGWAPEIRRRFATGIANRRFVVYLAPETIAEMFLIGATRRADRLQSLAALTLEILNGRMLNYYFWRILDEVRPWPTSPFMAAGMARSLRQNIEHLATGGAVDPRWYKLGAEMVGREKADDQRWRTMIQEMYPTFRTSRAEYLGISLGDPNHVS
jgi:hypothetical protein